MADPQEELQVTTEAKDSSGNQDSSVFALDAKKQLAAIGTSGTTLNAGYFSEEYLRELRGRRGARTYDEMGRSEPQIAMLLASVMNPIKSASWEFEAADGVDNAEVHKELVEFCAKEEIDFETYKHEALSMLRHGFSMFEIINSVVVDHPKFGTFNGLKALAFRSQKTIERWGVDPDTGDLKTVEQIVEGDLAGTTQGMKRTMNADYLSILTVQKEGDNYEGISVLRPMFGPWFRKNLYLKITAIGAEKNAVGTPIGTIPAGKETAAYKNQLEEFKSMLSNFTAHEQAYLLKPEGWNVEMVKGEFDAEAMKDLILMENTEMINAVVANFLALGTNGGGGAFALGKDLSDFFLAGIQLYANIIEGAWNRKIIPNLVKLNFGPQAAYPKLKITGIDDNASTEFATALKTFIDSGVVKADERLETFIRKLYKLPSADPATSREKPTPAPFGQFSEKFKARHLKLAETYKKQWTIDKNNVKDVMTENLTTMLESFKKQIAREWKGATEAGRMGIAMKIEPQGLPAFKNQLREAIAKVAAAALQDAKKETPKAKSVKLSERYQSLKLASPDKGFYDYLPDKVKRMVKNSADLIVETQAADMNKIVSFQFASSAPSTDSVDVVLSDIDAAVLPTLEGATGKGMSIEAAAGNAVSSAINQTRMEWFFEPEVLNTIESFTFTNEDPVSEICQELDGTTWAVGDPDLDRYTPPLHHNCKSRLTPNEKGQDGNPEINRGGTAITQKALDSITLCECNVHLGFQLVEPKKV